MITPGTIASILILIAITMVHTNFTAMSLGCGGSGRS